MTIVVSGAQPAIAADLTDGDLRQLVESAVGDGLSTKDAIAQVTAETGLPRKRVYAAAHS